MGNISASNLAFFELVWESSGPEALKAVAFESIEFDDRGVEASFSVIVLFEPGSTLGYFAVDWLNGMGDLVGVLEGVGGVEAVLERRADGTAIEGLRVRVGLRRPCARDIRGNVARACPARGPSKTGEDAQAGTVRGGSSRPEVNRLIRTSTRAEAKVGSTTTLERASTRKGHEKVKG